MSEIRSRLPRKTKLVPHLYAEVENDDLEEEEVSKKLPKLSNSNEENSQCFKLEPVEESVPPRFLVEATEPINMGHVEENINDNEIEHIKKEVILENEINEALKKTFNNMKSKAPIENKLQETIHNMINENSDEDVIDKSDSFLYPVVNVFNDTKNRNTIENQDEQQTKNAHDTKAIYIQKKELADKNQLDSKDKTLNEIDVIIKTSTNLVEQILAIEIKNYIGRTKFVTFEESKQETMLQKAFEHWKEWQSVTNVRGVPLCYKCYVCEIAFWHLHPFREHIRAHENIKIGVETKLECVLKAYETDVDLQNFHIDSDCWRCGKDFKSHPTSMHLNMQYKCPWCNQLFFSCTALRLHENVCFKFLKKYMKTMTNAKSFQCTVCSLVVWQENELAMHMVMSHSVRSDLPIAGPTARLCEYCNQKYVCRTIHICSKKNATPNSCLFCNRLFPTSVMLDMHSQYSSSDYKCPVCDTALPKQCLMAEHLTLHSENFQMMYKSILCNKTFLDKITAKDHNWRQHRKRINRKCNFYECIIVLKKTLESITSLEIDPNLPCNAVRDEDTIERNNININTTPTAKKSDIIEKHIPNNNTVTSQNTINNKDIDVINEYDNVFVKEESDLVLNDENDSINGEMNIKTKQDEYDVNNKESASVLSDVHQSEDSNIRIENEDLCEDNNIVQTKLEGHCSFQSSYRQDKAHTEVCHSMSTSYKETKKHTQQSINCTKCSNDNQRHRSLKKYLLHLQNVHNLDKLQCPECCMIINNFTSLALHLNKHIKGLYMRVKTIKDKFSDESESSSHYMCKKCKMQVEVVNFFTHWETHLVLLGEEGADSDDVTMDDNEKDKEKKRARGDLDAEALKEFKA